jgi:hypothetical protein
MKPSIRGIALRIIENASRKEAISVSVNEGVTVWTVVVVAWSIMVVSG